MDVRRLLNPPFATAFGLLVLTALALPVVVWALQIHLNKKPIEAELKLTAVSAESERFKQLGVDKPLGDDIQETLGTHNYISRVYIEKAGRDGQGPRGVELHVAYYTGAIDTVPHVPERCMVGGGWNISGGPWWRDIPLERSNWIEDDDATAVVRAGGSADQTVWTARLGPMSRSPGTRVRLPVGIERVQLQITEFSNPTNGQKMYAGYFFIANGGLTASAESVRLLAYDLRSEYAFYCKVQFSSPEAKSPEDLAAMAGELLDDLLPDIMLCVPDWVEVLRGDYPADNPRRKPRAASVLTPKFFRPQTGDCMEGIAWLLA